MKPLPCRVALPCCLVAVLMLCGCGSGLCPVEGTVTYKGQPLEQGRIGFHPDNGRPAYGEIKEGRYTLFTHEPGDAFSDRISLIPERYTKPATSKLEVEVKPGTDGYDFSLTE